MQNVVLKGTDTYHVKLVFKMSHEFIHSLNECLLSDYYMRGTGDIAGRKRQSEQTPCCHDTYIPVGRDYKEKKEKRNAHSMWFVRVWYALRRKKEGLGWHWDFLIHHLLTSDRVRSHEPRNLEARNETWLSMLPSLWKFVQLEHNYSIIAEHREIREQRR